MMAMRDDFDAMDDLTVSVPRGGGNPDRFSSRLSDDLGGDPEAILQEYRDQVDRVRDAAMEVARQKAHMASLASRFTARGSVSHWDAERKALLCRISERLRADILAAGGKPVEKALETESHADSEYTRYLERARVELEQYEEQQAKLSEAFASLDHQKGVLAYLDARLQMMRALSYAWGGEARLTPR